MTSDTKRIEGTNVFVTENSTERITRTYTESEALAMVAAENEAAQSDVWAAAVNTDKGVSWVKSPNDVAGAIRSRLTAPQVAALEKVKAEARLDEQKKHGGHLHGCNAIVGGDDYCNCGFAAREIRGTNILD